MNALVLILHGMDNCSFLRVNYLVDVQKGMMITRHCLMVYCLYLTSWMTGLSHLNDRSCFERKYIGSDALKYMETEHKVDPGGCGWMTSFSGHC